MAIEAIIQPIVQYLQQQGFVIVDESKYFVELQSRSVTFYFGRDPRESGYSISVGIKGSELVELYKEIYESVFVGYSSSTATYPYNFIEFLHTTGRGIVVGDRAVFQKLSLCFEERNRLYNYERKKRQTISLLEKLWQEKDYRGFIFHMDRSESKMLPKYYGLRYKIAVKRAKVKSNGV